MTCENRERCPSCSSDITIDLGEKRECLECGRIFPDIHDAIKDADERINVQKHEFEQSLKETMDYFLARPQRYFIMGLHRKTFDVKLARKEIEHRFIKNLFKFIEDDPTWRLLEIIFSLSGLKSPYAYIDISGDFDLALPFEEIDRDSEEFFVERISEISFDELDTLFKKLRDCGNEKTRLVTNPSSIPKISSFPKWKERPS